MAISLGKSPQTLADRARPSLDILTQMSQQARIPQHKTFVQQTTNRTQEILKQLQDRIRMPDPNSWNIPQNQGVRGPSGPVASGGGDFESFVNAISGKESGGNYRAVNPHSGAMGKYQIMPGNVRAWSREILGYSISPQQFLANPQLQEQIARGKLLEYYKKYGAAGAAVAWYAGPGAVRSKMNSTRNQGGYPSIQKYWQDILRRMG